jgi:hypothetical protein
MVHSGYEATAVMDSIRHPLKAARVALAGPRTEGPMAPDLSLENQRRAEYVFSRHVQQALERIRHEKQADEPAEAAE